MPEEGGVGSGIAIGNDGYYRESMQSISLKLPESLLLRLEEESRARGLNKSALIREALERALAGTVAGEKPSCADLAWDLAGSIQGLPRDIAKNPKYLEGFGE